MFCYKVGAPTLNGKAIRKHGWAQLYWHLQFRFWAELKDLHDVGPETANIMGLAVSFMHTKKNK